MVVIDSETRKLLNNLREQYLCFYHSSDEELLPFYTDYRQDMASEYHRGFNEGEKMGFDAGYKQCLMGIPRSIKKDSDKEETQRELIKGYNKCLDDWGIPVAYKKEGDISVKDN